MSVYWGYRDCPDCTAAGFCKPHRDEWNREADRDVKWRDRLDADAYREELHRKADDARFSTIGGLPPEVTK